MSADKNDQHLHMKLDMNVLNHLGIGLYSNTPAVLTEIIANGWDADATELHIDIDDKKGEIVIRDNGIGMDHPALQDKFLTVGYARREHNEASTPSGRQCMGRKGIGKLAMFSLANEIHLVSRTKQSAEEGFIINVGDLKEEIVQNKDYYPVIIDGFGEYDLFPTGTTIILKDLNKRVNRTESFLRRRIARRFSILGASHNFKVFVNGNEVTIGDRGFYDVVQLLWTFGDNGKRLETEALCENVQRKRHFDGIIDSSEFRINGFIAGVTKPQQLITDDDNNNKITLMANGRIFDEDLQKRIDDSKVFNSYLVGELEVDFLDKNDRPDMAVSSRQGVQENDPRFQSFMVYLKSRLSDIAGNWDEWRRELGGNQTIAEFPKIQDWIETLKPKLRTKAKQLVGKVNTMRFSGAEDEQKSQKREVIRHHILAFEKLQLQDNLEAINGIDIDNNVTEFNNVLLSVEDLEASMHRDIVEQRLAVVSKLKSHNIDSVRERVVQEHIYEHLWLVDSSWEYKDEPTDFELKLSEYLKQECPDTTEGARLDIGYRTTAGKYIVIELKKPGITTSMKKLIDQGEKYSIALRRYFHENPGSCPVNGQIPVIEVIFLVDKRPPVNEYSKDMFDANLKNINGTINTYTDLINQAERAYDEFLKASRKVNRIREIIDSI